MAVQAIDDRQFQAEVLQSPVPVLVDFWSPWCGPCRMLAPELEKLASRFQGRLKVVKLNVDENPEVSRRFQVRGIPYLLLFRQGQVVAEHTGFASAEALARALEGAA
ncbi:MAG: thioredoxin [Candidatus Eremiobacterota bacterium]